MSVNGIQQLPLDTTRAYSYTKGHYITPEEGGTHMLRYRDVPHKWVSFSQEILGHESRFCQKNPLKWVLFRESGKK